jgi:hypothetical protein
VGFSRRPPRSQPDPGLIKQQHAAERGELVVEGLELAHGPDQLDVGEPPRQSARPAKRKSTGGPLDKSDADEGELVPYCGPPASVAVRRLSARWLLRFVAQPMHAIKCLGTASQVL